MKRAWSATVAAFSRVPSWALRLALVAFYSWLAARLWHEAKYGWYGAVTFCAGEAWSRVWSDIRLARQERLRATWEDLARKAISRCDEQHSIFIEMGPPLEVLREELTKRKPTH
jgi:hypothetical protein